MPNSRENSSEAHIANIWLAPHLGIQMECMSSAHNLAFFQSSLPAGPQLEARGSFLTTSISIPNPWPGRLEFTFWSFLNTSTSFHPTAHLLSDYLVPKGLLASSWVSLIPSNQTPSTKLLIAARWVFKNVNLCVMIWLMPVCFQLDCGTDLVCFADVS